MKKGFIVFGAGLLVAGSARGQVSALINYPMADVLGHREFQINHNFASSEPKLNTAYVQSTNYLLGLFDVAEISGITDWQGTQSYGLKVTPYRSKDEKYSFGFGWHNVRGENESPFAMGRANIGTTNLHLGWQRDSEDRVLLGFDHALGSCWTLSGEYAGSASGGTAFALTYALCDGVSLMGIYNKPHDSTVDASHTFVLTYTFRI